VTELATSKLTEAQFQRQVVELAKLCGWSVAHFRPARTEKGWRTPVTADGAGFPDLVLARPPELVFAELKSERGKPSPAQVRWLEALCEVAAENEWVRCYVWRPSDFEDVRAVLA